MPRRSFVWHGLFGGWVLAGLAAVAPAHGADIKPGEVLVGELNCAACHAVSGPAAARLASRQSPILGEKGRRLTPQWLREYLRDPQGYEPGTTMPDALHALPPAEKTEAAEALTHYLLSLQNADRSEGEVEYDAGVVATGRTLYHTVGCVACHAAQDPPPGQASAEPVGAPDNAAPLDHLASQMTVPQLAAFLRDPLATRPAGRMPSLNLNEVEATAIAMYLQRDQQGPGGPTSAPGLRYEYYEATLQRLPRFDRLKAKARGIAREIGLDVRLRDDNFALRFTGDITVPVAGEYTFFVVSDDGARLLIDDKEVLANDGTHAATEGKGSLVLTAGAHALTVLYFNGEGGRELHASWQGPTFARQDFPAGALSHPVVLIRPVGTDPAFAVDAAKAVRGRELFASLNCASCHEGGGNFKGQPGKPLAELNPRQADACIAENAGADRPQFILTSDRRNAIRTVLAASSDLAQPLSPAAQVDRTMTALNCYACHSRDGHGGPEGQRREYFTSPGEADLGDEGRFPPALSGVGAKLKPTALAAILWQAAVARPYMATRMPQFGQANAAGLVRGFEQADDPEAGTAADAEPAAPPEGAGFGRKLAGTGGLACIACHNFAGRPALGVPALDMTLMYGRLKYAWFHRYLLDPQALRPGTRMPAFWPDGHASDQEIYQGHADEQIAALREYLAKGKQAELPDGLIPAKAELVARNEAVVYRNFIEGAGPRSIGVGYPEKVNLAFDAQEDRLALIWQGAFIDASRHRTGRAQGYEPPLGVKVVSWTPGAPFARLSGADAPWPAEVGRAARYQFRGYRLEGDQRRPVFRYDFAGGAVTDEFGGVLLPGAADASLRRTLVIQPFADRPSLPGELCYFRAAVGDNIEMKTPGTYVVDHRVTMVLTGGEAPMVRQQGGRAELLVPFQASGGDVKLEETLTW